MEDTIIAIIGIVIVLYLFRLDAKSYEKQNTCAPRTNKYNQDAIQRAIKESEYRGFSNYKAYLESDEWKEKRLQRLKLDKYTCQHCQCDLYENTAHIHHLNYNSLYDEHMDDLISLCKRCHQNEHLNQKHKKDK